MKQYKTAIIYMLLSATGFSMMNVFVRLAGDLPTMQKAFFRNIVSFTVAAFLLYRQKVSLTVPKGGRIPVLARSICGTVGIFCNFYSVSNMPLADASMLSRLSPFFSMLFAHILLKEQFTRRQMLYAFIAIGGGILILKPTADGLQSPVALVALVGGMFAGIAYSLVRMSTKRGVASPLIVFYFSLFSCTVALPSILFFYVPMTNMQLFYLLMAGVCGSVGQIFMTYSYKLAPATEVSIFDYSQFIVAAFFGYVLFGQTSDFVSILGYVTIFGAAFLMYRYNRKMG